MTLLEKRIKDNKQLFEGKFVCKSENSTVISKSGRVEFRPSWESGWENGRSFQPIIQIV